MAYSSDLLSQAFADSWRLFITDPLPTYALFGFAWVCGILWTNRKTWRSKVTEGIIKWLKSLVWPTVAFALVLIYHVLWATPRKMWAAEHQTATNTVAEFAVLKKQNKQTDTDKTAAQAQHDFEVRMGIATNLPNPARTLVLQGEMPPPPRSMAGSPFDLADATNVLNDERKRERISDETAARNLADQQRADEVVSNAKEEQEMAIFKHVAETFLSFVQQAATNNGDIVSNRGGNKFNPASRPIPTD